MNNALSSAVTGLSNFQKALDVVANNIANVNTAGFKASKINFQEMLSTTIRPAAGPNPALGGTNAVQVGLGSSIGSIDSILTQGTLEVTGNETDLAITGDGYFVVGDDSMDAYSRNGHFSMDASGNIVDDGGRSLKGWQADLSGAIDNTSSLVPIKIPLGDSMTAQATTMAKFVGNLDGSQAVYAAGPPPSGGAYTTQVTVYDSLGQDYRLDITFTKAAAPVGAAAAWDWNASLAGTPLGNGQIAFNATGTVDSALSTPGVVAMTPANGANPLSISPDFSTMTQLVTAGTYTVAPQTQDGFPAGNLTGYTIGRDGLIVGQYSNALTKNLGQVALAHFNNPQGLQHTSSGLVVETANSGRPQLGAPGSPPLGEITSSALEMSNVDLSTEFTRLITAQRAFQANSKVITTMDEVLNEVSNLRR